MKIITLMENMSLNKTFLCEHGLSMYIETKKNKILFDTGKSNNYIENANKLGINLADVDIAFLSHGHYDHGGGLKRFIEINENAKIYIHKEAFGKYYAKRDNTVMEYIGLPESLRDHNRIIYTNEDIEIDDELKLFMNIKGNILNPESNQSLYVKRDDKYINDDFIHEQNLIITENNRSTVFCGCAHRGIVNIIENYKSRYGNYPDHVVGGFHLYKYCLLPDEKSDAVVKVAEYLKKTNSKYYTCHCTGEESFKCLKSIIGNDIEYLKAGSIIEI